MRQIIKKLIKQIAGYLWFSRANKKSCTAIVLSWNRAYLTNRCLESLIRNGPPDLQVILVDNASKASEKEELKKYITKYGTQVEAIWLNKNYGGVAFNLVSWRACGEYILFCENDLEFVPRWFDKMRDLFDSDALLGQVSPLSAVPQLDKGEVWTTKAGRLVHLDRHSYFQSFTNLGTTSLVPRRILRKGVFWKNISSANSSFRFPDDGNFSGQIRSLGFKIGWVENPLVENRGHRSEEWDQNPEYYLENWKLKSELGIDTRKNTKETINFLEEKNKHQQSSLRSRQIYMQRNFPHLVDPKDVISEIGQIFLNSGNGFQIGEFIEFEYILGKQTEVSIELQQKNISQIRIDPIDCPAKVELHKVIALSSEGESLDIFSNDKLVSTEVLCVETQNEKPEILICTQEPIDKLQFIINVQVHSHVTNES